MNEPITFFVPGKPKTAGSKKAFAFKRKNGTLGASVTDDCKKSQDWKALVSLVASSHKPPTLWEGPLELELWFHVTRPKCHFRTGKNSNLLKDGAPTRPIAKPDATKMTRAVEDALTGILWHDDAQIVDQHCHKVYAEENGVYVKVRKT